MSWDEAFSVGYEEWSAHMTADIAFYTKLAVQANGPLVGLRLETVVSPSRWLEQLGNG